MPASSAMRASLTLSGQVPDQRSGTNVTARPDEQLAPNRPILSALPLYMAVRSCMEAVGASMELSINIYWRGRRAAMAPPAIPRVGAKLSRGRAAATPSPLVGEGWGGGSGGCGKALPPLATPTPDPSP